jgi:DNA-binding MarR family transcriptional regulator
MLEGISAEDAPAKDRDYELFYRVSSVLSRKQSMTMGEVSAALSAPLSKATRTADWLVARGYIERIPDREDRRIVRILLTPNGLTLHRLIEETIRRRIMGLLASLSVNERENLFRLIGKVVSSVKELPEDTK